MNDSGIDGSAMFSPLTIASYAFTRPTVSSDLIVSISCSVYAAPYASSAHTSISPKRWPPNCALPPSGCWVTSEYGPVRARVDLVVDEVEQLEDVHVADGDVLLERLAGAAVVELHLPGRLPADRPLRVDVELDRRVGVLLRPVDERLVDVGRRRAVEDGRRDRRRVAGR